MGVGVYRRPFASAVIRQQRHGMRWVGTYVPTTPYDLVIDQDNPISHWKLGEASGNAIDRKGLSPGVQTGTVRGATGLLTGNGADKAVTLDTNPGDTIIFADRSEYDLATYSIEFWVNLSASGNGQFLLSKALAYNVAMNASNQLLWRVYTGAGTLNDILAGVGVVDAGSIYHIVGNYDGQVSRLYINGKLRGILDLGSPQAAVTNANDIRIGTASSIAVGTYDELAIYGSALSLDRVQAHYIAGGGVVSNAPPPSRRKNPIHAASKSYRHPYTRAQQLRQLRRGRYVAGNAPSAMSTLVDAFDTSIDAKWTADAGINWLAGRAIIPASTVVGERKIVTVRDDYTIDGSYVFGEFRERTVGQNYDQLMVSFDGSDPTDYVFVRFDTDAGAFVSGEVLDGSTTSTTNVPGASIPNYRWWAIVHRLTGGLGTFEWYASPAPTGPPPTDGSASGNGWTQKRTAARQNPLRTAQQLQIGSKALALGSTGQFTVDNINNIPSTTLPIPRRRTGIAPAIRDLSRRPTRAYNLRQLRRGSNGFIPTAPPRVVIPSLVPPRRRNPINAQTKSYRHPYSRAVQLEQLRRGRNIGTRAPTPSLPSPRRKNPLHPASRSYRHPYSRAQQLRQLRHGSYIATRTPTVAPTSLPPPAPQRRLIAGGKTYRKPLPRAYHRYLIRRTRWIGTSGDTVAPTPNVVSVDVTKISRVAGKDIAAVDFTTDEAFVEYEVRVVPDGSSPRGAGSQLETAVVASRTAHSISVTDDELVAASGVEGTNVLKVFVKDVAGNWST